MNDFLSGNNTWAKDMLFTNFLNAGDSTVERGNISSITYSDTKLLVFASETGPLLTNIHCLFAFEPTLISVSSFLHHFVAQPLSSVSHNSLSISTNAVVLCTVSRCFLKLEVVPYA